MAIVDLHIHTTASDGVLSPEDVVKKAASLGLSAIAISDHDEIKGVAPAILAGKKYGLEVIPAIELSSYWISRDRKEFHILGYFIDVKNPVLLENLARFGVERRRRAKEMLKLLANFGYASSWQSVKEIAKGAIGQPHIARVILASPLNHKLLLKNFGKIPNVNEFIREYLIRGRPCHVGKAGIEPKEAIDLIHGASGVAVLAHPGFGIEPGDGETIKVFRGWGIDGLEALAPIETKEKTRVCREYFTKAARENGLLITGGSDYHGLDGVGAGLGLLEWGQTIDGEILEELKAFHEKTPTTTKTS